MCPRHLALALKHNPPRLGNRKRHRGSRCHGLRNRSCAQQPRLGPVCAAIRAIDEFCRLTRGVNRPAHGSKADVMTTEDLWAQCRNDFEGSKSFFLSSICLLGFGWIVSGAIANRHSLMFWLEWERTALIATGIASAAFWLAAFFWPPQHFQYTKYKVPGIAFSFLLAMVGSAMMIIAGLIATRAYDTMTSIVNHLDTGTAMPVAEEHMRELAQALQLQSLLLMIGILFLCITEIMFLIGTKSTMDAAAKPLREDYRNCLKFSDGPCCIIFAVIYISIGLGAHEGSGLVLLMLYKVFVAGAVALQVSLSNIVFIVEFAEGWKKFFASFFSFLRLPFDAIRLAWATATNSIQTQISKGG